jgi:phosphate starvation-inducible PhoH-like protein
MAATIMDGKALASKVKEEIRERTSKMEHKPGLAVVLVGDDPASRVYVNGKKRDCGECGIYSEEYALPAETSQQELLELVAVLNAREDIDGILVQLPLPRHLDEKTVLLAIRPDKDVDCFHPFNVGQLMIGETGFQPCTPAGIMRMLKEYGIDPEGKHCVIVGRSNIVGKPQAMLMLRAGGTPLEEQTVRYCISLAGSGDEARVKDLTGDFIAITAKGRPVRPKTLGQKAYIGAIVKNAVTFGVGPAGTGKTYLAVAMAVKAFKAREVSRIILTRPAVEAGEKLGFLPGDLQNKVDPYLRPLYDALFDMLGAENYQKLLEKQLIEVAPLAYMRGRTLDDAFIILDEAQNTSPEQMKMFLTRMGAGSKVVVTGDITQIDLPDKARSGLVDALGVLKNVEGIAMIHFSEKDVVRHRLVQEIIRAYDKAQAARNRK